MKCNYDIFFSIFVLGQLWWLVGWSHLCGACFPALLHAWCFIIAIRHRWARCGCPSWVSSSARWLVSWELAGGNRHFPAESLCSWPRGVPHMPAHRFSVSWARDIALSGARSSRPSSPYPNPESLLDWPSCSPCADTWPSLQEVSWDLPPCSHLSWITILGLLVSSVSQPLFYTFLVFFSCFWWEGKSWPNCFTLAISRNLALSFSYKNLVISIILNPLRIPATHRIKTEVPWPSGIETA